MGHYSMNNNIKSIITINTLCAQMRLRCYDDREQTLAECSDAFSSSIMLRKRLASTTQEPHNL